MVTLACLGWDINERVDRTTDNKIGNFCIYTYIYEMHILWNAQIYFLKNGSNIWINWDE